MRPPMTLDDGEHERPAAPEQASLVERLKVPWPHVGGGRASAYKVNIILKERKEAASRIEALEAALRRIDQLPTDGDIGIQAQWFRTARLIARAALGAPR